MQRAGLLSDDARRVVHLLLGLSVVLFLAFAGPPAMAEDGDEDDAPIERDIQAAREAFEEGEVKRDEFLWNEAADVYWKAVEADLEHYLAHVRYQEASLRAGDALASLVEDYDSFLEDYPKHVPLKLHRLRLNPPGERVEQLEALLQIHTKDFNVLLEIGRAHLALGQGKEAVKALEKSLALKLGSRTDILLMLAEAEAAAGKPDAARTRLEGAIRGKPDFWQARLDLARLEMREGRYEQSLQQADAALQLRTKWIGAFLVKSEALSASGKPDEAKAVLRTVYDRITKSVPEVTIALADLEAQFETEAGYKLALELYKRVIANDEENVRAWYGMAWALERQEKYKEAEEGYREVMGIDALSVMAVNSVGHCLFKQGRVTEAQVQFKRALDLEPEFVTALANLGSTLDAQAKYGEAIKVYEKILKMKGQKENLRAIINCAFDYEATGAFPKAAKLLEQAHEVEPDDANIMVWLGDNHYFQKKWKDAEAWYQRAIALDEKSFFAWRGLGLALGQRKRWADSANAFEKAKEIKRDDMDIYVTLGDIYYQELKDLENALVNYEEYIQRGGNDPEVIDVITEIKKELEDK